MRHRVDLRWNFHDIVAVLPTQAAGTPAGPVRPKHAPAPQSSAPSRAGILDFTFELSDDGKHGTAEFVAVDSAELEAILADTSPGVLAFEKGVANKSALEAGIAAYHKPQPSG
jgi:hypothetical protein